jgi:nuclear transport factor 2 (NTF2) superfamily protein
MWEFNEEGLMAQRYASINDAAIREDERRLLAPAAATRVS